MMAGLAISTLVDNSPEWALSEREFVHSIRVFEEVLEQDEVGPDSPASSRGMWSRAKWAAEIIDGRAAVVAMQAGGTNLQ